MKKKGKGLPEIFSAAIEELRASGRWGTAHVYQSTWNAFSAFVGGHGEDRMCLSPGLLGRFEVCLRQRGCSWNTVATYMRTLRSVYNRAVEQGDAAYVPRLFAHVCTGACADRKRALDTGDMCRLLEGAEHGDGLPMPLRQAAAFFSLMFLLRGLPFVDLVYLRKADLRGNVLYYRRKKTGRPLRVVLPPEAVRLLSVLVSTDGASPYLFPFLHSREGSEEAYREYQSALRVFNARLAALQSALGLEAPLTTYAARHTWATAAYHCEVHPGIISEAMGHSSISVTETYLKPFRDEKIHEANQAVLSFVRQAGEVGKPCRQMEK